MLILGQPPIGQPVEKAPITPLWSRWFANLWKWVDQDGIWTPISIGLSGVSEIYGRWRFSSGIIFYNIQIGGVVSGTDVTISLPRTARTNGDFEPSSWLGTASTTGLRPLVNSGADTIVLYGTLSSVAGMYVTGWYEAEHA